jgi:hypothetical protein
MEALSHNLPPAMMADLRKLTSKAPILKQLAVIVPLRSFPQREIGIDILVTL